MLSENQRHELIGLIVAGYSRYAAAKKVGCARSTIYRLAARDPVFGERLAEAEELAGGPDTRAFLQQPKHWREAARVLQQINPEDFRLRRRQVPSTSFSLRGEAELFGELMEMILPAVSDEVYSLLIREINKLLAGYDSCDVPQLEDATKTEFGLDRDLDSPSHPCAPACLEGKQCGDSVSSESWEPLLALQASSGTPPQPDDKGSFGGSEPGGTLGDAVPQPPWDLALSCQARSDGDAGEEEENREMAVTVVPGSGLGAKALNPGGLGAEPPGTLPPDEPDKPQPAPVEATVHQAEEPVLQRSSQEWPTYVESSRPNSLLFNDFAIFDASNVFAQIQSGRARKSKRTAHGGKPRVGYLPQPMARVKLRAPPGPSNWRWGFQRWKNRALLTTGGPWPGRRLRLAHAALTFTLRPTRLQPSESPPNLLPRHSSPRSLP
jgi:hypothetical protein